MYYRPQSQRGPYLSKIPPHEKKGANDNQPPRDAFDRIFPSPPPPTTASDDYPSDTMNGSATSAGSGGGNSGRRNGNVGTLQNISFSSRDGNNVSPFSRTTSQNGGLDAQQEKTVHQAYHVSFHGDKRVRETNVTVVMNDQTFLLVERTTAGQSDGVYQKNKKLWEYVPRGQIKVFVSVPVAESSRGPSAPSTPIHARSASCDAIGSGSAPLSARGRHRYDCVAALSGLRKFGHWGDKSAAIFAVPKETAVEAVAIERVDGVGGHVAAMCYNGERYWIVGGKERHIITRFDVPEEDVLAYLAIGSPVTCAGQAEELTASFSENVLTSAARSLWDAQEIARTWRTTLETQLDPDTAQSLHAAMVTNGWTLCFDALLQEREGFIDYSVTGMQPMWSPSAGEDAAASDAGTNEEVETLPPQCLVFYAITTNTASTQGVCLPVESAYDVFQTYRLTTAPRSVPVAIGSDENLTLRESIASKLYSAGGVFYGMNASGMVVQLWKCRCTFHSMERVAQESVVTNGVFGATLEAKFKKSISNLPKTTRPDAVEWEEERGEILAAFSEWLYETKQMSPSMDAGSRRTIRDRWLTLQRAFWDTQDEHGSSEDGADADDGAANDDDDASGDNENENRDNENDGATKSSPADKLIRSSNGENSTSLIGSALLPPRDVNFGPEAIVMVGPQGCGKSTIARVLYALLEQSHQAPRWLNQDEAGSRHAYIASIERTVKEGICTHLLLDKMNLNAAARNADYGGLSLHTVLTISWMHTEGKALLADVCFDRICERGDSHRSLKSGVARGAQTSGQDKPVCDEQAIRRLRGILEQSVAKMEIPNSSSSNNINGATAKSPCSPLSPSSTTRDREGSTDLDGTPRSTGPSRVVELDVRWDIQTCIEAIWPRLCALSDRSLPMLKLLDLTAAVDMSHAYESLLSRHPHRTTSVVLELPSPSLWTSQLPKGFDWESKRRPRVAGLAQFVIHDFVADPSPSLLVEYDALDGKSVELELEAVVSDCRAAVLCAHRAPFLRRDSNLEQLRQQQNSSSPDFLAGSGSFVMLSQRRRSALAAQNVRVDPLLFAVVAQAKKVPLKYCRELVERLLIQGEADPYCSVFRFPPSTTVTVTYALKSV